MNLFLSTTNIICYFWTEVVEPVAEDRDYYEDIPDYWDDSLARLGKVGDYYYYYEDEYYIDRQSG